MQAKRRATWLVSLALAIAMGLAGAAAGQANLQGQTLNLVMLAGYKADAIRDIVPIFEQKTGARVVVDELAYGDLHQRMLIELASGRSSYDVLLIDEPFIASMAAFLEPLDPYIARDSIDVNSFVPTVWAAGTWEGTQVAMPLDSAVQVFFYRTDVLSDHGIAVPDTWDEVMAAAQVLTDPDANFYGYALAGMRAVQAAVNVQLFMWSFGGEVFDDQWRPMITSDASLRGLEFYRRLHHEVSPPGSSTYDFYEVTSSLQQGRVAMAHQWVAAAETLLDRTQSPTADHIGWALMPQGVRRTPTRGVWSAAIPKGSPTREAAWELIKWLSGEEAGAAYAANGGGFSPRVAVLRSDEFRQQYAYADVLLDSLMIAKARPRLREWGEVNGALELLASQLSSGTAGVTEAAARAEVTIEQVVRRAGLLGR